MPVETGKEKFFAKLAELVALAKDFPPTAFDEAAPEETTKHMLIRPLLKSLGYEDANIVPEFKILGDQVDYLLKSDRPLLFLEAKSLIDASADLFEGHNQQVLGYLRNYRVSPEQTQMEQPVTWLVVTNFKEWHFIRVTEEKPSFSFKLNELIPQREKLWELLARENVEAGVIDDLYEQSHKADLDKAISRRSQTLAADHRQRVCAAEPKAFHRRNYVGEPAIVGRVYFFEDAGDAPAYRA